MLLTYISLRPTEPIPHQLSLDDWATVLDTEASERRAAEPATNAAAGSHSESQAVAETASSPSALLTTHEAAQLLHVHPRTVQRLVERGELGVVHIGGAVRFDPVDLETLTGRLKQYTRSAATTASDSMRPHRRAGVSFADRLRSKQHEHRAAQA